MQLTKTQQRNLMLSLFLIPFLLGTGIDLYVPSLPAIAHYFQVSHHLVQFTIGLYMLGYAFGQVVLGVLSDSVGRKKILVISGFLFSGISFLAALSPNVFFLIACRFFQGFMIAGAAVVCRAMATDCFSDLALTKAMTHISTSWALGPIIGPAIGGYLQHFFNWQADFYFFGIFSVLTFAFVAVSLSETRQHLVPFNGRAAYKIIKEVVTHPIFLLYSLLASLFYAILVVFNVVAPFLIQVDLHYSVVSYGHLALLLGFGYFAGSLSNRYAINYFPAPRIVLFSTLSGLAMCMIMACTGIFMQPNLYSLLFPALFLFFFCGLAYPNLMVKSAQFFPKIAGTAGAIYGSCVAGSVFLMTTTATGLPTHTQTPVAMMYLIMLLVCLILFMFTQKLEQRQRPSRIPPSP